MISSAGSRFARFDQFVVDVARRRLTRDGEVVPLNSKTFDLLLALLESRGGLMTKDDLLARVWPGVAVEEGNLTVHVSALRRALGERRGEHRFVVTVPGRGYTFVADVMRDDESFSLAPVASAPAMATPRRTARRVAALAAAALVATFAVVYWRQYAASTHDPNTSVRLPSTSRLLTAVGNVGSACLSPDGKSFAFVAVENGPESLWVGHVDGRPPARIRPADDTAYEGLAFSPRGDRIYYTAGGLLYDIPAAGGSARQVASGISGGFSLSPDGARIAFTRRHRDTNVSAIVVDDLEAPGREREVASLPAGRVFSSFGPSWSPDGTLLAVGASTEEAPGHVSLAQVRVSDGAVTVLDARPWNAINKVAWFRDGSGIAFHAVGVDSDYHVWFFDSATRAARRLSPDLSRYGRQSVSVSDDGTSLLAVRDEIESTVSVGAVGAGGRPTPITSRAFGKVDGSDGIAWTPDARIVYVSMFNGAYALWTIGADGSDPRRLTSGSIDRFPRTATHDRLVIFESNRGGGSDIWRIDADGTHLRRLTAGGVASQPDVSPDGRWVFYASSAGGASTIRKIAIDGGRSETVEAAGSSWPRVSPDGTRLAFASIDPNDPRGATRLAIASLTTNARIATFDFARGATVANGLWWSPDGSSVMYRDFSQGVWQQSLSGGPPAKVAELPERRLYFFEWSKDGRQLARSFGDDVRDAVLITGFR